MLPFEVVYLVPEALVLLQVTLDGLKSLLLAKALVAIVESRVDLIATIVPVSDINKSGLLSNRDVLEPSLKVLSLVPGLEAHIDEVSQPLIPVLVDDRLLKGNPRTFVTVVV